MAYDLTNGYQPETFDALKAEVLTEINEQFGTTYDEDTIVGTDHYKFFYAGIQLLMRAQAKFAELTSNLTDFIRTSNEKINLPKSTISGFIAALLAPEDEGGLGLNSTIKDLTDPDEAGHLFLVVDADDGDHATGNFTITSYTNLVSGTDDSVGVNGTTFTAQTGSVVEGAATFQAATSNSATATSLAAQINAHATVGLVVRAKAIGAVVNLRARQGGVAGNSIALAYTDNDTNIGATKSGTALTGGTDNEDYADLKQEIINRMAAWLTTALYYEGIETGSKMAVNGQTFTYAYDLPDPVDVLVRITVTSSANATTPILNENQVRDKFNTNFAALYRLGLDFEPEKYLEIARDCPFASDILTEWSEDDGDNWSDQPRSMAYNEKVNLTAPATISVVA
jgi:hypothetical protein